MSVETRVVVIVSVSEYYRSLKDWCEEFIVFIVAVLYFGTVWGALWLNIKLKDEYNLHILERIIDNNVSPINEVLITAIVVLLFIISLFFACYVEDLIYPLCVYFTVIPFLSFNEAYFIITQFIMAFLILLLARVFQKVYYYNTVKLLPCFSFFYYYIFEHIPLYLYLFICSFSVILCFIHPKKDNGSDISC